MQDFCDGLRRLTCSAAGLGSLDQDGVQLLVLDLHRLRYLEFHDDLLIGQAGGLSAGLCVDGYLCSWPAVAPCMACRTPST